MINKNNNAKWESPFVAFMFIFANITRSRLSNVPTEAYMSYSPKCSLVLSLVLHSLASAFTVSTRVTASVSMAYVVAQEPLRAMIPSACGTAGDAAGGGSAPANWRLVRASRDSQRVGGRRGAAGSGSQRRPAAELVVLEKCRPAKCAAGAAHAHDLEASFSQPLWRARAGSGARARSTERARAALAQTRDCQIRDASPFSVTSFAPAHSDVSGKDIVRGQLSTSGTSCLRCQRALASHFGASSPVLCVPACRCLARGR
jgi:hypothetical protein